MSTFEADSRAQKATAADAKANGDGAAPPAGRRSGRSGRHTGPSPPDVVEAAARRLRVMGHPVRLRLIEVLANGPQSVTELAAALGIEHQLISKHLNELHRCDVVTRRQDGNFAVYSLPDALTLKAVALVCRSVLEDRVRLARAAVNVGADGDGGPSQPSR
ncbi:ArsR/SmtB family transcription factor [Thermoleophilum album]|uniref:DNA-binding transcriptional regulator, ArsR family n=1 Tax=Thermoleophilum album TaxID=29539 RepID=A0A1H6FI04_THEAL|nr:metalloregulator ArsR/SmtB family transcription factor [Thermoleophilum album]SEH10469.1 DNA-binding transcriptional regulator, ArsR family [Thermoleophilum album]